MEKKGDVTLQRVKKYTIERLTKYGKWGDTFDDVVNKVLDMIEKKK